jgi:hypothetical protein
VIESFLAGVTGLLGRWGIHLNHVNRFRPDRIMLGWPEGRQTDKAKSDLIAIDKCQLATLNGIREDQ